MGGFAVLSGILMFLPILFVNEKKYCHQVTTSEDPITALKSVFANRNFRMFALSDLMYWLSLTFIQMGVGYYITVLLDMPTELSSSFLTMVLAASFLFYIPINIFARKYGKKMLMVFAFIGLSLTFGLIAFLGKIPLDSNGQIWLMGILTVIPLAVFSILPNAIVADLADKDGSETGNYKAGMFFAARTFMMKLGISLANLLFTSLLLLGRSVENDFGIRMTGIAAVVFCVLGCLFFMQYNEKEVIG